MIVKTRRALAEALGVSHTTINKDIKKSKYREEPGGGFDVEKCRAARESTRDIAQPPAQAGGAGRQNAAPGGSRKKDGPQVEKSPAPSRTTNQGPAGSSPKDADAGGAGDPAGDQGDQGTGNVYEQFNRARALKEMALAEEKQLNLRLRREELIERAEIVAVLSDKMTAFNNRLLLMPDKLAPVLAAKDNVLECRALIEKEVRQVINTLAEIANAA